MELANFQLRELEAYDGILDDSLDRAYRDLRELLNQDRTNRWMLILEILNFTH
jgi:hypothetical protein